MNNCSFSGRLVRDPEYREFKGPDGAPKKVTRFTVAIDRKHKKAGGEWENDPCFLDFEVWDSAAETVRDRYKKGSFILIADASAKTDRWEGPDGKPRSKVTFRCNRFELLPRLNDRDPEDARDYHRDEDRVPYA